MINKSVGKILGDIAGGLHLYQLCSKIGIEAMFYRICYKKELIASYMFYEENKNRVLKNADMFTEDESRKTYLKAIDFRKTHRLKDRPDFCKENEYFNSLTKLLSDEVLIDCGAYTGDSVESFVSKSENHYKKIVAFEPDSINFLQLKNCLAKRNNCVLFKAGVWNEDGNVSFREGELAGSKIDELSGGGSINVTAIDHCMECQDATFIKMDIEGSELMALQGARETILRNRPLLTICIYHTDEDMLSIPEWMRENLIDYKYYCRHHSYFKEETIIYAIPYERC